MRSKKTLFLDFIVKLTWSIKRLKKRIVTVVLVRSDLYENLFKTRNLNGIE